MINVLYVFDKLGIGGTEKSGLTFIDYINSNKLTNVYICSFFEKGDLFNDIKNKFKNVFFCNGEKSNLEKIIEKNSIKIIHFNRSSNRAYEIEKYVKEKNKNIIIVETTHFGKIAKKENIDLVDYRIFVSNFTAMRFIKKNNIKINNFLRKNTIIYNPINIRDFNKFTKKETTEFRRKLRINDDEIVLAKYGRKDNLKISPLLVDVVDILSKKNIKFKFIIVGVTDGIKKLIKDKNLNSYFIFIDKIMDKYELNKFISSIDILVHASLIGETFGYVYVESMYYGKPIITNATPMFDNAQIEIIKNNKNGFIRNTPETISKEIIELINNKVTYKKISKNAHNFVIEKFSVDKLSNKLLDIYENLISGKNVIQNKEALVNLKNFINSYESNKYGNEDESLDLKILEIKNFILKKYYSFLNK